MSFVDKYGFELTKCIGVDGTFGMSREKIELLGLMGKSPITGRGMPIAHCIFASSKIDTGLPTSQGKNHKGEFEDVLSYFFNSVEEMYNAHAVMQHTKALESAADPETVPAPALLQYRVRTRLYV